MDLNNKTVLVTGGGSGIGLGIARALADEGCRVALTGRSQQRLDEAAATFDAKAAVLTRPCDVADRAEVGRLVDWFEQQWGTPDVLVNSAGINVARRAIADLDPADFDRMMAVNNTGTFNCIHAVLPQMCERGDGLIVNISSIAGKRGDMRGGMAYSAAKFAQSGLGMTLGAEVGTKGVRVTNIYPGETNTPILEDRPVRLSAEHLASILQPEDVAAAIRFVACLPPRAHVPELVITPTWQPFL